MCSILACCGATQSESTLQELLQRTASRGPDASRLTAAGNGFLGFNRLSIMGLTDEGMQPFVRENRAVVCNGELYGFRPLRTYLEGMGESFVSDSDCEILLPLYARLGCSMFSMLDAEFALVLYDGERGIWVAARDPIGIRPLYYGRDEAGTLLFASEPKSLVGVCARIRPFPPGYYYEGGDFVRYADPGASEDLRPQTASGGVSRKAAGSLSGSKSIPGIPVAAAEKPEKAGQHKPSDSSLESVCSGIRSRLIRGVQKRLDADAPVGFLLSGGLDSSLVCGIAARMSDRPLETFSIGMDKDAIDLKYARQVAEYIGSHHHEVIMTRGDVLAALEPVIAALGTWDITTVRASIGMYLVCKWIHENTDIRVLLTGEISDELFGYKYTDFAPSPEAFQEESIKRVRELHMYDVLRADRCISVHSLEARVPFGDLDFVRYVMAVDPALKMNRYGIGKYLLRHAFEGDALIPESILMREKAAFSDAVGHSMKDDLTDYAETLYTDEAFREGCRRYTHGTPFTKESLLYRDLFEKYYPGQGEMIADFWMPNRSWEGCDVDDPSARVLANYGKSGE